MSPWRRPRRRTRSIRVRRIRRLPALLLACTIAATGCAIPRWPVEGPMTSAFGVRWRGILPEVHRGVDIAVPVGTPIRAMAGGVIRYAGVQGAYGNVVWIDHGGGVITLYAHLSAVDVRTGQRIGPRAVIGRSGATGNATGAHLHFEVWRWGQQVDPVPLLGSHPPR